MDGRGINPVAFEASGINCLLALKIELGCSSLNVMWEVTENRLEVGKTVDVIEKGLKAKNRYNQLIDKYNCLEDSCLYDEASDVEQPGTTSLRKV